MGRVVRIKRFPMEPMTEAEAIEQMELLGHDFFLFQDADKDTLAVLYRREDGAYGMILPDTSMISHSHAQPGHRPHPRRSPSSSPATRSASSPSAPTPGGKGINVSRVIHELGGESLAMGFAPGGLGRYIEQTLNSQGIPTDFLHTKGEVRTNITILDESRHMNTILSDPGPETDPRLRSRSSRSASASASSPATGS